MIRKTHLYTGATMGWFLVVAAAVILVYSGNAAPYVTPAQVPLGPVGLFGAAVVAALAGVAVVTVHRRRSWRRTGSRIGLTPEGGGPLSLPELTGRIDGRSVRARTISRNTGGGGESGSSSTTFTVAEATLSGPADVGLFVGPVDRSRVFGGAKSIDFDHVEPVARNDDFAAFAGPEAAGEAVISGRAREALRDVDESHLVAVGNTDEAVANLVPETGDSDSRLGSFVSGKMEELAAGAISGNASTVTLETRGLVHDSDRLERQLRAVAAVADAFETATAGEPDARSTTPDTER